MTDAEELCLAIIEATNQADYDLCGEQREFLLPRLRKALACVLKLFPMQGVHAMTKAKDAWGEPIVSDED
jgi:hypothetical protein